MDDEPLVAGRVYWALHGHRWVKAKVRRVVHRLDINTLAEEDATQLEPNAIGHIELSLQEPIAALPYSQSRRSGVPGSGRYGQPQDLGCRCCSTDRDQITAPAFGSHFAVTHRNPIKYRVFHLFVEKPT
jgi:hypothetical protein